MFKIQMIQTNETVLNFENWNFGFACPVKYVPGHFLVDL